MVVLIVGILLVVLGVLGLVVMMAYRHVSIAELKRRARTGETVAVLLYRSAAYGLSAPILLGLIALVTTYFGYILLVDATSKWLALPIVVVMVVVGLIIARAEGSAKRLNIALAAQISPPLAWSSEHLHPMLHMLERGIRCLFPLHIHSGVYEKEDLVKLLEQQKQQADNRIPTAELNIAQHALTFSDQTVAGTLIPKRVVASVSVQETVGPMLMSELHDTGHSRFPVYEGQKDKIVGVLYLHDLIAVRHTGTVREIMRPRVVFVHENFTLYQALQAFLKTKQHLFIVVNEFEEYVGIITIEDILERIIGTPIMDEFDQYEDLRAVAAIAAAKEHRAAEKAHSEPTMVVESAPSVPTGESL